jgi:YidC/Oxa1 family membrane protein insertase
LLTIANKGYIVEATLKNFKGLKGSGELVKLIKTAALLNVQLITSDNRTLNTRFIFEPNLRSWI